MARDGGQRLLARAGLVLLAALLLWHMVGLLAYIREALRYPFQLDYGEGIVWQQMRAIWSGTGYAPLGVYPAIVYHYPPVYHGVSAALAVLTGLDELVVGRLLSVLSALATAWMIGHLVTRMLPATAERRVRLVCAVLGGLLFLTCYPVRMWVPVMRVDMLAGALGLAGMLLSVRALRSPAAIYGASLLFVLAMFTKQISVAAPAAAFGVLLWARPALALRGIILSVVAGLAALSALEQATHGEFLRHIVGYNVNRLEPRLLIDVLLPQIAMHFALIGLAGLGGLAGWRFLRSRAREEPAGQEPRAVATAMLLLFVALKTIMLLMMAKSGSGYNYMIEWFSGVAILAGVAMHPYVALALGKAAPPAVRLVPAVLLFIALPMQLVALHKGSPDSAILPSLARVNRPIVDRIATASRPVIADDMTFLLRAGRPVRWEAAITAELGAKGVYDQNAFARLVDARCFGFFVIEGRLGHYPSDRRYNPVVVAAIRRAYPRIVPVGNYGLHLPVAPPDAAACRTVG